jgi:hypothetical protein
MRNIPISNRNIVLKDTPLTKRSLAAIARLLPLIIHNYKDLSAQTSWIKL